MVKNKSEALLDLLLGVVFLVAGVLFIAMKSDMLIVKIVLIADLAIGALLFFFGITGLISRKNEPAEETVAWDDQPMDEEPAAEAVPAPVVVPVQETFTEPEPQPVEDKPSLEELTAREAELRKIAKQRRMEARHAAAEADRIAAEAAEAERALVEAENAMKHVSDAEKSSYLAKIDRLADDAMDKSQQAAFATRKAKAAEKAYRQAVAAHQEAMDLAAEAMLEAEDSGI